ncbi:male-enhanced antigen 1 [Anabas testudineus]|uniref:male-enhanced antigen 1 n=1 Tax=Anabas testudineus TaxID=64144 RepID=UPI000E45CF15|nr:male-enhanced antigen 1 [Anabas testudineus]XP_026209737.1 male-enhanced antigen 1 [Anabas testudineus]
MEVCSSVMGPERVLPSSEDELGEDERPVDGGLLPGGAVWSGGAEAAEEEGVQGGEMALDGEEEEEEEEVNSGGYYYQPLNQDPDGLNGTEPPEEEDEERGEDALHTEQLQQVQQRIEVMGLHLPEAPPPDSDEEEDPEGAAALRSRASIPMDADHVELVKRTMAAVALPSLGVPPWAREISDDQWTDMVQHTLQSRQSAGALRLARRSNVSGP